MTINNLNKFYEAGYVYNTNLKTLEKLGIDSNSFSQFKEGLKTLESYGLISYVEVSNPKLNKVSLKADIEEIKSGIEETNIFVNDKSRDM